MKKLLCFLLCLGMVAALAACASPAASPAQSSVVSESSSSSASAEPSAETSSSSASAAPSAEASSSSASAAPAYSYHTIAGSHVTDISMGLDENFNIPRAAINYSNDLTVAKNYGSSSYTEPNTGLEFSYDYSSGENFEIIQIEFGIMNSFLISEEDFYKVATSFLSFCATMPYDSSDISTAKKFIEENIKNSVLVEGGNIPSIKIGDAVFELYSLLAPDGTCIAVNLSIVAEGLSPTN